MKKTLMIIGGFVVGIIILGVIIFSVISATSKKNGLQIWWGKYYNNV